MTRPRRKVANFGRECEVLKVSTAFEARYEQDDGKISRDRAVVAFTLKGDGRLDAHPYTWDDEERRFMPADHWDNFKGLV